MMTTAIEKSDTQTRTLALAEDLAWTPEALKQEVEREKQLRTVVIQYYRSQLQAGHHYYNLPGQGQEVRKPALAKEGALNLASLFKVVPEPDEPHESFTSDGHYSVRFRYRLRSLRTGQIVATGDGSCTTREEKYAYRWVWERDIPANLEKDALPQRWIKTRSGLATKYRVPNEDLPTQYNTVLKMGSKRALVDASLKLPLVSELFTQDLEEQIAQRPDEEDAAEGTTGEAPQAGAGEAHTQSPSGKESTSPSAPAEVSLSEWTKLDKRRESLGISKQVAGALADALKIPRIRPIKPEEAALLDRAFEVYSAGAKTVQEVSEFVQNEGNARHEEAQEGEASSV